jgi:hypothetical protein
MAFGIPAALLFGLVLIIASLSLFVISKLKPNLYEESDNIYVIAGIVCGLLLMVSLDLGAAMAFQQLLLLSVTISLMWRFINLRAENKQLKNRQSGTDRPKSVYNARLEDDYVDTPRERRQGKRRRSASYEDEDLRLLGDRQESAVEPMLSRRRTRSFDVEDSGDERYDERRSRYFDAEDAGGESYGERRDSAVGRRSATREDETDRSERSRPRTPRRALPEADLMPEKSPQRFDRDLEDRSTDRSSARDDRDWNGAGGASLLENRDDINEESPPRSRRKRSTRPDPDDRQDRRSDSRSENGSMAGYVNYEPVDPPSGLPPSGSEPIVFPDRY